MTRAERRAAFRAIREARRKAINQTRGYPQPETKVMPGASENKDAGGAGPFVRDPDLPPDANTPVADAILGGQNTTAAQTTTTNTPGGAARVRVGAAVTPPERKRGKADS